MKTTFQATLRPMVLIALGFLFLSNHAYAEMRDWKNKAGKTIKAEINSATKEEVVLKMANGKNYKVAVNSLSEADQKFIVKWLSEQSKGPVKTEPSGEEFENWEEAWPKLVSTDNDPEIIDKGLDEGGKYVFQSPRYEFICDTKLSKSVVKRFAVLFEATNEYIRAIPFSMAKARSEKRHKILLFETREAYFSAGAPQGSAGVYMPSKDVIMVPLTSLGVKKVGKRFVLDTGKGNKTLPHEITHQLTDRVYYQKGAQGWFSEGMAEYVGVTPYRSGKFTVSTVLQTMKAYVTEYGKDGSGGRAIGDEVHLPSLKEWMLQSYGSFLQKPQINYGSGALIFYYFAHMDGEKDGAALLEFCKALKSGKKGEDALQALLAGRTWAELEESISNSWRSRGVRFTFN